MSQRILVAEDEFVIAYDLRDTFEEAGYVVEGPHTGISSAMLACQKARPDLAILDIQLVDGTVYELAHKLFAENVPVIFHSGADSHAEVARRFPGATTLIKPCPPADMLRTIHSALAAAA